jgi:capsular polysaccharide biosynthesis protein
MTDSLPKIGIAEKAGFVLSEIDTVLVSSDLLPFQQDTLAHFGIKKESRISLATDPLLKCDELIMPSATCLSGNVSPWIIDFLRLSFKSWMQSDNNYPSNIFIGRKNAQQRVLLNEEEVSRALEKKSFKIIYLEELSVKEQIKIFYNAKKIISIHGAGLTNLVFSQAGSFVLELFPVNYVNQCYWTISTYNELDYSYVLGEGVDITDDISHLIDGDFSISIEKILHILEISKL